jgi:hypothetical protein
LPDDFVVQDFEQRFANRDLASRAAKLQMLGSAHRVAQTARIQVTANA